MSNKYSLFQNLKYAYNNKKNKKINKGNNCDNMFYYLDIQLDNNKQEKFCSMIKHNFQKLGVVDYNSEMAGYRQVYFLKHCLTITKKKFFNDSFADVTITETNAGLGGFTYLLLFNFNKLNVIDIDEKRINFIKSNINNVYSEFHNIKNKEINFYSDDCSKVIKNITSDIIISDFPWGGVDYKKSNTIRLLIQDSDGNDLYIDDMVVNLYKQNKFKIYLVYIPKNFDLKTFNEIMNKNDIKYDVLEKEKLFKDFLNIRLFENFKERFILIYNPNYSK